MTVTSDGHGPVNKFKLKVSAAGGLPGPGSASDGASAAARRRRRLGDRVASR
jgi:hypothetical protein